MLLLQEFHLFFKDKNGVENVIADHLSRLRVDNPEDAEILETFPDEYLYILQNLPWYADIVNYLVTKDIPTDWSKQDRDRFLSQIRYYVWDDPYLFKYCPDQVFRRCVLETEQR